jgi:hypothetical protein
MTIMCGYALIFRFALGRVHYTKYFDWGLKGLLIGGAYSVYFTGQKIDAF